MEELISVIIPVFNIEAYLPRCLESITTQSYRNLEIIIVDDGSTDSSGSICDEFAKTDGRAKVIHQKNQGLWAARNAGKRAAHGDYLIFPDGDDYLHVDAIRVLYDAINQDGGYDLAIIDRKITERQDEDFHASGENRTTVLSQEELVAGMFNDVLFVYQWNRLYRRELIDDIWCEEYHRSQDFDFNFRVYLKTKKAIWVHRILYFYLQRPKSLVRSPGAYEIFCECRTRLFYKNFMNLPADKKQYAHYLLRDLYKKMVFYKGKNYRTNQQDGVFGQCREYERATRKAYWLNRRINPIEKIGVTLLLHSPRLTRWLMIKTKNY